MSMDRTYVRLCRSPAEADDGGFMQGTPEERLSQVWELTKEAWSWINTDDVERRLQRDVVVFFRRKG
jgi:hypothetical protein